MHVCLIPLAMPVPLLVCFVWLISCDGWSTFVTFFRFLFIDFVPMDQMCKFDWFENGIHLVWSIGSYSSEFISEINSSFFSFERLLFDV